MKRIGGLKKFFVLLAVALMAALVASCASGADSMSSSGEVMAPGQPVPAQDNAEAGDAALPQEDGDGPDGQERLIIRTKTLRLEVEKTADTVDDIRDLTRTHSGTISDLEVATDNEEWIYRHDENASSDGAALRGWVTVRVPTDKYEDFVAAVTKLGVVKFQSEAASDVTQEYVDLSARLENLRAQEVRLREFFEAAKDVKDMLAIETELGRVRGEIESLDAQVTYLERQAAMATVTIELTEERAVVRPGGESWGFVSAITAGVRGAASLMIGLLTVIIATAPLWIVAIVAFFIIRRVMRNRRAKAPKNEPTGPVTPSGAWAAPEGRTESSASDDVGPQS